MTKSKNTISQEMLDMSIRDFLNYGDFASGSLVYARTVKSLEQNFGKAFPSIPTVRELLERAQRRMMMRPDFNEESLQLVIGACDHFNIPHPQYPGIKSRKVKKPTNPLHKMAMHQFIEFGEFGMIIRVPGGWLYQCSQGVSGRPSLCFVPYSEEFMNQNEDFINRHSGEKNHG